MRPGKALTQTLTCGIEDFPGYDIVTMSHGGPGKLVNCLKCVLCGYSERINSEALAEMAEFDGRSGLF
jgi:hypothetical protein